MGWNEDANRRRVLRRFLQLWNMVPDNTFAEVVADVFGLQADDMKCKTDEAVFSRINDLISGKADMIYKTKLHRNAPTQADNISAWQDYTSDDYVRARSFLDEIKVHTDVLTRQEYATIKGMALQGDIMAAREGLTAILERKQKKVG